MYGGVVDLSKFNEPQQVSGLWVVELEGSALEQTLALSNQVPVLVVFYSVQSQNSLSLVADLEKLVVAQNGRIQLAKVDVDAQREVAQAFGIAAVPAAAALLQAQPLPLFQGMPEADQLTELVTKLIDAAANYGLTAVLDNLEPDPLEVPPLHQEGLDALERGDLAGAHAAYTKALAENPGDRDAKTALHQIELLQRMELLNESGIEEFYTANAQAPLTDVTVHLQLADIELSLQRPDAAFSRLIDVVRNTAGAERDSARERLLAYFEIMGSDNEMVVAARKALTNALF